MKASVNAWKIATIGMAAVTTSLVTALVVGHMSIRESGAEMREGQATRTPPPPMRLAIETCNQHAAAEAPLSDTTGLVTDLVPGAGTLYGLNDKRGGDERYRAAYTRCMRARGYLG
jgi:hypothetical protein